MMDFIILVASLRNRLSRLLYDKSLRLLTQAARRVVGLAAVLKFLSLYLRNRLK
jgi:hypothetical protein